MKTLTMIAISVLLSGCGGGGGSSSAPSSAAPAPVAGDISAVMAAAGCTVTQLSNGVQFDCNGTTASLYNGNDGATGAAGANGTNGTNGSGGLAVYDGSNALLPNLRYIGTNQPLYAYTLWSATQRSLVAYSVVTGKIGFTYDLRYELSGCTGRQFVQNFIQTGNVSSQLDTNQIISISDATSGNPSLCRKTIGSYGPHVYNSHFDHVTGVCIETPANYDGQVEVVPCSFSSDVPETIATPIHFQ